MSSRATTVWLASSLTIHGWTIRPSRASGGTSSTAPQRLEVLDLLGNANKIEIALDGPPSQDRFRDTRAWRCLFKTAGDAARRSADLLSGAICSEPKPSSNAALMTTGVRPLP